jgi:glutaconate CoA-transferase subunit A
VACKIAELDELVREIPDGAEIALGSFAIARNPIAFANELIRQKKKNLKIYGIIGSMDADMLVGAGCVEEYSYGGGSLDRFGRINRVNEAIEKNSVRIFEYSGLGLSMRFLAGCSGIPYIPGKTLLGTDILANLMKKGAPVSVGNCPFTGEKVVLFKALQPEYAVIHANAADERGNVIIEGPIWDEELAKSAKKLIVTVDQIVANEYVKRNPHMVKIPNVYTYAVAQVPFGAFPTDLAKAYDYDGKFLEMYAEVNKKQATFDEFIKKYVLGTKNHYEFLELAGGMKRMMEIRADPVFGYKKY